MFNAVYILNTLIIVGMVSCALLAASFKKTLSSVIALAGVGSFASLEFIMLHAPDVAIAEVSVGVVLTTIIFIVGLRKTGGEDEK